MRRYYTIEKTTWTSRSALEMMIKFLVGNRKSVEKFDGLGIPKRKNFSAGRISQKKNSSDGATT